jgi:hypothetical protein
MGLAGRVASFAGIVSLAVSLGVIGVCSVVPQIEENASLNRELEVLRTEHTRIESQIKTNDAFVAKLEQQSIPGLTRNLASSGGGVTGGTGPALGAGGTGGAGGAGGAGVAGGADPTLLARLAQRQLRLSPEGTATLEIKGVPVTALEGRSPFQIVSIPRPAESPQSQVSPLGKWEHVVGFLRNPRTRLYVMATAFFVVAASLILDGGPKQTETTAQPEELAASESTADSSLESLAEPTPEEHSAVPTLEPAQTSNTPHQQTTTTVNEEAPHQAMAA